VVRVEQFVQYMVRTGPGCRSCHSSVVQGSLDKSRPVNKVLIFGAPLGKFNGHKSGVLRHVA